MGIVSILSVSFLFSRTVYNLGYFLYSKIMQFKIAGFNLNAKSFNFDPFFINTHFFIFLSLLIYVSVVFAIIFGQKMTEGKWSFSFNTLYFFPVFSIIAPFWLMKAVYNTVLKRKPAWR
jgi:hypothetical protein